MAHETHTDENATLKQSKVSFQSSFWLIIILVGVFISALNFIQAEGGSHEGEGAKKEAMEAPAKAEATEAKTEQAEAPAKKENNTEANSVNGTPKPEASTPAQPEHK